MITKDIQTVIHLRAETKPLERRTCLSPTSVKELVSCGYHVHVERSPARIYEDEEYEAVGAELAPEGSWPDAPSDHLIIGLKELPDNGSLLPHTHVHFGHCFKQQDGWADCIRRYHDGGGKLYDLEFLCDNHGRRVAAFGYWAGYAGAAIAVMAWSHQLLHPGTRLDALSLYDSSEELRKDVTTALIKARKVSTSKTRVIIIGGQGRCGKGAIALLRDVGLGPEEITIWTRKETSRAGPFPELNTHDILVNCIYLGKERIPPFVTPSSLSAPGRRLRVISDVSLDPNNPNNPLPVYSQYSSFLDPTIPVSVKGDGPQLTVVSIDHLPNLIPREASDEFSAALLPTMRGLEWREEDNVWRAALAVYNATVKKLPKEKEELQLAEA
ncbi:alanine dehydrogenase [Podospora aff. communis PSN243]|uniref:Saccharopine dehydrogenase [NAD(+), L-lysine-forming] n=1 Tax=Podospora aff. communis PSN243 TaxID=3040156 RepID=A0AAV9G518_9PEZI|nr:alanine dehydrogenase [Podospora aff. communis PSN243]